MENKKLTPRQDRFVDEYLVDLNGTQAAIRSGYSERTANEQAARLLAKASVQQAIAERKKKRQERTEVTQDYIVGTIQETVERCRQAVPVLDKEGNQVMVETPTGELAPAYIFDPKNVLKGCELLGKHIGLFEKDNFQKRPMVILKDFTGKKDEE